MSTLQMERRSSLGLPTLLNRLPNGTSGRPSKHFEIEPLSPTIGAQVNGVDFRQAPSAALVSDLRTAMLEWKVLFFRDQALSDEEYLRFGRCWGDLFVPPMYKPGPIPEIMTLARSTKDPGVENLWHSDLAWLETPGSFTVLKAEVIPPLGGDTLFADMAAAYDNLAADLKNQIEGRTGENSQPALWGTLQSVQFGSFTDEERARYRAQFPPVHHPLVRTHPETGRRSLYCDISHTAAIDGLPADESEELLDILLSRASVPEYQCRFHWTKNAIAVWDNRTVQHYASSDYLPNERLMKRLVVAGQRPV